MRWLDRRIDARIREHNTVERLRQAVDDLTGEISGVGHQFAEALNGTARKAKSRAVIFELIAHDAASDALATVAAVALQCGDGGDDGGDGVIGTVEPVVVGDGFDSLHQQLGDGEIVDRGSSGCLCVGHGLAPSRSGEGSVERSSAVLGSPADDPAPGSAS